jgi:class 3 adenylate cyclase
MPQRPTDERLERIIRELEPTGGAIELLDADWHLVWVSDELKGLLGVDDEQELGYGEHILKRYQLPPWRSMVDDESAAQAFSRNVPYLAHGTPGGVDALRRFAGDELQPILDQVEPSPVPALWAFDMEILRDGGPAGRAWCYSARLHDENGQLFGIARLYTAGLPAHLLALVTRGDEVLFERMAQVAEPGRRAAAVLFADLDSSGVLSRRLAGAAYFRLIAAISSAIDGAVIEREGIVGKHAGDGATAFFLTDHLGSDSAAARAALQAACDLPELVERAVAELSDDELPIDAAGCRLNVGVHWGAALFMGALTTTGRLEVTALGDEVNECARIEQSASDGQVLASKAIIERLSDDDATALRLAPEKLAYHTIAELSGADEKASPSLTYVSRRRAAAGSRIQAKEADANRTRSQTPPEVADGLFQLGTRWVNFHFISEGRRIRLTRPRCPSRRRCNGQLRLTSADARAERSARRRPRRCATWRQRRATVVMPPQRCPSPARASVLRG